MVIKGGYSFDESNGTDGDIIFLIYRVGGIIFFYHMGYQPKIVFDQLGPSGGIPLFHAHKTCAFFFCGEWFGKMVARSDM